MSKSGWMNPMKIQVQLQGDTYVYLSKMIEIFFEAIRGIYYHRAVDQYIQEQKELDPDWYEGQAIYILNTTFEMSIIKWAKLFGSESSQDLHVMNFLKYEDLKDCLSKLNITTKEELEKDLLSGIRLDKNDFDNYKNESIIKYRDQFIAHMDLKFYITSEDDEEKRENKKNKQLKNRPMLDIAFNALKWLYSFITKLLSCKKSNSGEGYMFAIYDLDVIDRQISEEYSALIAAFRA